MLRVAPSPVPTIDDDEVLVCVEAAGVDRGTRHLLTGRPYLMRLVTGLRRPRRRVPGRDLAGTVVAVGSAVTRFTVSDVVFGVGRGTFAEYAAAKESNARTGAAGADTRAGSRRTDLRTDGDAGRRRRYASAQERLYS